MPVSILVGAQWGDEGKGKLVDALAPDLRAVVRFQGGPNAGHTVIHEGRRLILHQVPAGILHAGIQCIIAPGVLLDPWRLAEELDGLRGMGCDVTRLAVSPACHVIMPWHRRIDEAEEELNRRAIGTTLRGIGPCASDKAARLGLRLGAAMDRDRFRSYLETALPSANARLKALGVEPVEAEQALRDRDRIAEELRPHVQDVQPLIARFVECEERVLMEGAQGTLLDLDWGTYPYVTSSSPVAGGACTGGGVPVTAVDQVIGVFKAYNTRVGLGPFPTEFQDEEFANRFRRKAGEFGATTGRPRRCGWFDLVAARYACRVNGFTEAALTKLDVLDGLERIQICCAYRIDGREVERMPEDLQLLEGAVEPVYEDLPGWEADTVNCRKWLELPVEAQRYVNFLEESIGVRVAWISLGPEREQLLRLGGGLSNGR